MADVCGEYFIFLRNNEHNVQDEHDKRTIGQVRVMWFELYRTHIKSSYFPSFNEDPLCLSILVYHCLLFAESVRQRQIK